MHNMGQATQQHHDPTRMQSISRGGESMTEVGETCVSSKNLVDHLMERYGKIRASDLKV